MTDYCQVSVQFSTEDRGRVGFQWRVTRDLATQFLDEFRERLGPPHQEAMVEADRIDEMTRQLFNGPGIVWVNHTGD